MYDSKVGPVRDSSSPLLHRPIFRVCPPPLRPPLIPGVPPPLDHPFWTRPCILCPTRLQHTWSSYTTTKREENPPTKMVENQGMPWICIQWQVPVGLPQDLYLACLAISTISYALRVDFPATITMWMPQVTCNSLDTISHGFGVATSLRPSGLDPG